MSDSTGRNHSGPEDRRSYEELERKIESLEFKIDAAMGKVEDLIDAYNTAKGFTTFIKWAASLVTALAILKPAILSWMNLK